MCVLRHPCSCVTLCAFIVEAYMDMTYIVMAHTVIAPLMHWLCARVHACMQPFACLRACACLQVSVLACLSALRVGMYARVRASSLPRPTECGLTAQVRCVRCYLLVRINGAGPLRALLSTGVN